MPKELRIAVTLEIPDDIWEQADALSAAKPMPRQACSANWLPRPKATAS